MTAVEVEEAEDVAEEELTPELLVELRLELEKRQGELLAKRSSSSSIDRPIGRLPDQMDETVLSQNMHCNKALDHKADQKAKAIAFALVRMTEGKYGRCIGCKGEIAVHRLRALPQSVTCLDCQEAHERENRHRRRGSKHFQAASSAH